MDEELLEKLLTKFIGLTEFGALRWHFAGDVSKAYVTVYKDARLKLTDQALDITEAESDTVRIDIRLHEGSLPKLLRELHRAARESSGRFRTGQVKAITETSLANTCQRLLEEEKPLELCSCLICGEQFDPEKSMGHISQAEPPPSEKSYYVCHECVAKVGLGEAQAKLEKALRTSKQKSEPEDAISGETLSDVLTKPGETADNVDTTESLQSEPESL